MVRKCGHILYHKKWYPWDCRNCSKVTCRDCKENFPQNCGIDERKLFQTLQKNNSSDVGLRTAEEQSEIDVLKAFVNELKINFGETFVADREKDVMDKVLLKKRISNSKMYLKIIKNSKRSKFEDFEFIAMLGRGAFGKVYQC